MTAALATADVQPLHVFAWIVDSGLRDSLKSLAHAILRRVDRHTWRWPKRHGAVGGVTVADLADGAGLSRRHAARCLRDLEELGLVRTTFRPFEVSEYELLPGRWRDKAGLHRDARKAQKDRTRTERIRRFNERRAAARARAGAERSTGSPGTGSLSAGSPSAAAPAAVSTAAPARAPDLPRWAWRHARRLDAAPETVFSLVGGAAAAILGEAVEARAQGGLARPVLKLWGDRGRPDPDQLLVELELVARWAQEAVHPDAVALRGAGRRPGPDRSRDARALCAAADFQQRLDRARGHQQAQTPLAAPAAPLPSEEPIPVRGQAPWIPPGQPPFLPGLGPPESELGEAWQRALAHLRREEDQDRGAIDIFLAPLRPIAVHDGVVVLAAPSANGARWIGKHLREALSILAESLGAPVGLVVEAD